MGLTKQYLRYVPGGNLNIIASPDCNPIFVTLEGQEGRFVAVAGCEHIYIWDLRLGEKVQVLSGEKSSVTCLAAAPNNRHIAAGYKDGSIKTFDLRSAENISIFVGHKSAITSLCYDSLGHRLVSGSKDTDIIVWDVVVETGICRLVGHKNEITQVIFMRNQNIIISSSKDTFIKFWDLKTEHNFKTLLGHRSEVYGLALLKDDKYLVTGCKDNQLNVWYIYFADNMEPNLVSEFKNLMLDEDEENNELKYPLRCSKIGTILRKGKGKVVSLCSDFTGQILGCLGTDNIVELFQFVQNDQIKQKKSKRLKKLQKEKTLSEELQKDLQTISSETVLKDLVVRLPAIYVSNKTKGVDLKLGRENELRVSVVVSNNTIELHSVKVCDKSEETKLLRSLTNHGHRTDVRAICFSSDNLAFATVSGDSIKLWNRPTLTCLRTVTCGYALSVTFVPGDRHLIVGMKDGKILIVDISSGDILEEIKAHQNEVWSTVLMPNQKGIASCSSDKTVKFWQFELVEDPSSEIKVKVLSLLHYKTLKLEEAALCVRISPNNRFVAVSLMDSTVKIFFLDTLKFFVSLYGHKLPVICMDISSDSTLIATGSADRNIKIWGMDFGDCHKSLFAHDDSVTGISFVPKTHYLFTSGKDGKIKQWDADIFQKIVTLQGHDGPAHYCTVSPNGLFVASCGADKVVRIYERSQQMLVLEDEAEEDREKRENELSTGELTNVQGKKQQLLPTRKTVNSEKAAELILECLEVSKEYKEQCASVVPPNPMPQPPMLMQVYKCSTVEEFLIETIKRVKASDLDEALLLLPFSAATEIIKILPGLLNNSYQIELVVKLALSLLEAHYNPIVSSQLVLPQIEQIRKLAFKRISEFRDEIGFNLYGLSTMQRNLEDSEGIQLFREAFSESKQKSKKSKNRQKAVKRAIMAL